MNRRKWTVLSLIILLILIFLCLKCCTKEEKDVSRLVTNLIVSYPEGTAQSKKDSTFNSFVDHYKNNGYPTFSVNRKVCPCDTLELWASNEAFIIIEGMGPGGSVSQKPTTGGAGENFTINNVSTINYNYELDPFRLPEVKVDSNYSKMQINNGQNNISINRVNANGFIGVDTLKIGVMDTGIDISKIANASNIIVPAIQSGDNQIGSWNFANNNNVFNDNHPDQHGTWVTKLMLNEMNKNNVKVYGLKVLDNNKQGSLFDLLCAIRYSTNINLNAINMSLGYYGVPDPLFMKYMKALSDRNIMVFAAAGNKNKEMDHQDMLKGFTFFWNLRNLDKRYYKFYPACFSPSFSNIYSTTSVDNTLSFCEDQNYSPKYIYAGLKTNYLVSPYFGFKFEGKFLYGSSFATPIMAGKILNKISSFPPTAPRQSLINLVKMASPPSKNEIVNDNYVDSNP